MLRPLVWLTITSLGAAMAGCGSAPGPVDGGPLCLCDSGIRSPDAGNDGGLDGARASLDSGIDAAAQDAGNDAASSSVRYCTSDGGCVGGQTCQIALCSMTSPSRGFCAETARAECGGRAGLSCPDTGPTVCLGQGSCVADALGVCVTPRERDDICTTQPTLWGC